MRVVRPLRFVYRFKTWLSKTLRHIGAATFFYSFRLAWRSRRDGALWTTLDCPRLCSTVKLWDCSAVTLQMNTVDNVPFTKYKCGLCRIISTSLVGTAMAHLLPIPSGLFLKNSTCPWCTFLCETYQMLSCLPRSGLLAIGETRVGLRRGSDIPIAYNSIYMYPYKFKKTW